MKRLSVSVFVAVAAFATSAWADEPAKPKASECIAVKTQARYVSGYDHLVHLTSTCEKAAVCQVSTNVNPKTQEVTVQPRKTETVLTFRGSPAYEFSATVDCKFVGE